MRIRSLVSFWEDLMSSGGSGSKLENKDTNTKVNTSLVKRDTVARDLFKQYKNADSLQEPLPDYEDCIEDTPPDYTATDVLANARICSDSSIAKSDGSKRDAGARSDLFNVFDVKVDFSEPENIRTRGKKKAKQAAKAAQQAKWADSDDEEKKDDDVEGEGGDGNGGGDAGGGNDGGGDPPGGDDGDGDDWWGTGGGGKKNKKKKKCVSLAQR